jgi:hypothetical protein
MVIPGYSRRLLANSRPTEKDAGLVAAVERGLEERFGGQDRYRVKGRMVLVRGEDYRCNGGHTSSRTTPAIHQKFHSFGSSAPHTPHTNQPSFTTLRSPHFSHRRNTTSVVNRPGWATPIRSNAAATAGHDSGSGQ